MWEDDAFTKFCQYGWFILKMKAVGFKGYYPGFVLFCRAQTCFYGTLTPWKSLCQRHRASVSHMKTNRATALWGTHNSTVRKTNVLSVDNTFAIIQAWKRDRPTLYSWCAARAVPRTLPFSHSGWMSYYGVTHVLCISHPLLANPDLLQGEGGGSLYSKKHHHNSITTQLNTKYSYGTLAPPCPPFPSFSLFSFIT